MKVALSNNKYFDVKCHKFKHIGSRNSNASVGQIDHPMRINSCLSAEDCNHCLDSLAMNLETLLDLEEKSCHRSHNETMNR